MQFHAAGPDRLSKGWEGVPNIQLYQKDLIINWMRVLPVVEDDPRNGSKKTH